MTDHLSSSNMKPYVHVSVLVSPLHNVNDVEIQAGKLFAELMGSLIALFP